MDVERRKMKIAVIEDDRGWGEFYRELLGDNEVKVFRDGIEAVQAMDVWVPEVIILDILLTGPTGFAVLNEIRSYEELMAVPVIIVSSVEVEGGVAEEYGVVRVLDKGEMRPEELLDEIKGARK